MVRIADVEERERLGRNDAQRVASGVQADRTEGQVDGISFLERTVGLTQGDQAQAQRSRAHVTRAPNDHQIVLCEADTPHIRAQLEARALHQLAIDELVGGEQRMPHRPPAAAWRTAVAQHIQVGAALADHQMAETGTLRERCRAQA
jgi:hypothetical protein